MVEMKKSFAERLNEARTLPEIFEVVKLAVIKVQKKRRAGLMLGIGDLGNHPNGFLGAFYPVATNIIVMNKIPMERIKETDPELYKPYVFHVLLHEYIHALGDVDEASTRTKTYEITKEIFGPDHLATKISEDYRQFFPSLVYPEVAWSPKSLDFELVDDFDASSCGYIH
jgi:hypothetical protein